VKVLVTGATGFLGRFVVARLSGEHEVIAMTRRAGVTIESASAVVVGDVLSPETLPAAMAGVDVLVHSAGLVSHRPEDAESCWSVHVLGTQNALDAARAAGIKRVVYLSTSGTVAVSHKDEVRDEGAADPLMLIRSLPYYRSKYFAEQIALERSDAELQVICLNPSLLLGPGDPTGDSTRPIRLFLEDQVPAAPPGGLSFVDVRDVAEAVEAALTRGRGGRRYLLGGANMSFGDFYAKLARISDKAAPPVLPAVTRKALKWLPKLGVDGMPFARALDRYELEIASRYWYLDHSRATSELGWEPRNPMGTLEDTVADLLDRRTY